jgi:type IV secretion system protein VirB6
MLRSVFLISIVVLVFGSCVAFAQTTQSILSLIAHYESSDNPTAQNPSSTASGLYGMLNSTWAEALQLCGCGSTAQYSNAASAPASVQTAAEAALLQQDGLSDYTCAGCDAALTAAINAAGGPDAFAAQIAALSTDPSTYGSLDTSGGLTDYFGGNGSTPTTIGGAAAAGGVTANAGATMSPFSYFFDQLQTTIIAPLQNDIPIVQGIVSFWVTALLSLSVMFMAIAGFMGHSTVDSFFYRLLRIAVVVPLVAVGSAYYSGFIVAAANALPLDLGNAIMGTNSTNPAAPFDIVLHSFNAQYANVSWGFFPSEFGAKLMIDIAWGVLAVFEAIIYTPWAAAQIILQFALVIGPVLVLGWLFNATASIANRWLSALAMLGFVSVGSEILAASYMKILASYLGINNQNSSGTQNALNLSGVIVLVVILGVATAMMPQLVKFIMAADGAAEMGGIARMNRAVINSVEKLTSRAATATAVFFLG